MGRTPKDRKPIDARDRARLIHGEDAREWRVHIVGDGRVRETVLIVAPGFDEAERTALALSRSPDREPDKYLVEPMVECEEEGCENVIIAPDPRTAHYPDGRPVHDDPLTALDGARCLRHPPVRS